MGATTSYDGSGKRRRPHRRARSTAGLAGVLLLAALVPGAAFWWSGRRWLGRSIALLTLALLGPLAWIAVRDRFAVMLLVSDPVRLKVAAAAAAALFVAWALVLIASYRHVRPVEQTRLRLVAGPALVGTLCLLVAAPAIVAARYAIVQADLIQHVFQDNRSATAPRGPVKQADPWAGAERVNVLLLGGDGGIDRDGVRTDSMILASLETRTGDTTLFSLPRNMLKARFPMGSPLHDLYPDGFSGLGPDSEWMLNAVYRQVPLLHPGVLGRSDNEGADAIKLVVQGTLGIRVDYYVLINLSGFRQVVDAMGGVTVNINEPVPIGGNDDLGILPDSYLTPGPAQRLDGHQALWFARGRYGSSDYARMERQRCMIDAIITEAKPLTLLRRYQQLAETGKQVVRTDLPNTLLPALVDLGLRMKQGRVRSVVFRPSAAFDSANPDFEWIRSVVRKALAEPRTPDARPIDTPTGAPTPSPTAVRSEEPTPEPIPEPGTAVAAADSCAYDPDPGPAGP